jgi:hypothetical protein
VINYLGVKLSSFMIRRVPLAAAAMWAIALSRLVPCMTASLPLKKLSHIASVSSSFSPKGLAFKTRKQPSYIFVNESNISSCFLRKRKREA